MGTNQIMYCIVALILGMLMANMLKSVCGCKNVVEGGRASPTPTGPSATECVSESVFESSKCNKYSSKGQFSDCKKCVFGENQSSFGESGAIMGLWRDAGCAAGAADVVGAPAAQEMLNEIAENHCDNDIPLGTIPDFVTGADKCENNQIWRRGKCTDCPPGKRVKDNKCVWNAAGPCECTDLIGRDLGIVSAQTCVNQIYGSYDPGYPDETGNSDLKLTCSETSGQWIPDCNKMRTDSECKYCSEYPSCSTYFIQ